MKEESGLEEPAIAIVLDTRIRNREEPNRFVAGADVRQIDTKLFETTFQQFDSKILVRHVVFSFLSKVVDEVQLVVRIVANTVASK